MNPIRIGVPAAAGRYEIVIGPGALADPSSWQGVGRDSLLLIVSNRVVGPLYADRVAAALRPSFAALARLDLPDGEGHKTWASVEAIVDKLLEIGADRRAAVLALGGGVVGDVAGFAAACYMRGIDCIQVPTSLLAQVDSSVGGKTAINHARGKNMIGAFHAPIRVVADIDTLATLPQRELIAGMAEIVKYGAVADDAFLGWLEGHVEALLGRDGEALTYAVKRSCELKAAVVAADERETGRRVILNFGHTFAHAIEAGTGYAWLHGEAVGCGMVLASEASRRAGLIDARQARRIVELVGRFGLPTRAPSLGVERYLDWMRSDKKAESGQIRLVLLDGPGQAMAQRVDSAVVASVLRDHERPT